jgi:hypothetical protein
MNNFIKQIIQEKVTSKRKKSTKKKEEDVDEIVDEKGNFIKGKKPTDLNTKTVTSNSTSDEVEKTGAGQSSGDNGTYGVGTGYKRYWGESDMSTALGYEDTLGKDMDYEKAKKHFKDELGLDDIEVEKRLAQMGYDSKLPEDKVRLVENPRKFVEEYLESILSQKTKSNDIVNQEFDEEREINPIILKQIKSLKNTLHSNNLRVVDVLKHFKDNE